MSRDKILPVCLLLASAAFAAPRTAHAVHKSWVIRNDGAQCAFSTPNPSLDNYFVYALYNGASYTRNVGCPLALSARWGSTTPSVPLPLWAGAWAANIYVNNAMPGTAVSCTTRAILSSGVNRYSRTVSTTAGGDQRLTTALNGDWGGTLETYETDTVRSMYFDCQLPGNYSAVWGYKVRICQRLSGGSDCGDDANGENDTRTPFGSDYVQTSGIECYANDNNEVSRGHTGLVNSNAGYASVHCPLTLPADDTDEAVGSLSYTYVHFKTSVPNQYPICQLAWRDRFGYFDGRADEHWSNAFNHPDYADYVYLASANTRLPVGASVFCDLPPGMTLQGITTNASVVQVNGGG